MNKRDFLAVQEIYKYQELKEAEVGTTLAELGSARAARLFYLMLQSFKITSRVAYEAWGLVKDNEAGKPSNYTGLKDALHDYSPGNFEAASLEPLIEAHAFAAACFEQFYNEASLKETKEEVEELLFQWTARLKERGQ